MGVDLGRVQLVLQIIDGLTDDYRRQIRSSLNCLRELKDMTMEWLTVSLLQEEAFNKRERQIRPSTTGDQQALPAKVGQGRGWQGSKNESDKSKFKSTGKSTLNCSHCYKVGHTREKCWVLHGRPNGKTGAKDQGSPLQNSKVSVAEVATTTRVGKNNINSNEWLYGIQELLKL